MRTGFIVQLSALAALFGAAPAAAATITTLDFADNICGAAGNVACLNNSQIGQSYGDSVGVDVSHASFTIADVLSQAYLKHWATGYGNLTSVAFGGSNATGFYSTFTFTPNSGYEVRLLDFSAACFNNRASCRTMNYSVTAGADVLASGSGISTNFPSSASISINSAWRTDAIRLRWGPDGYDVGLDNIRFSWREVGSGGGGGGGAGVIPEPATWAMMIAGFGLVGASARRRRRAVLA